MDIWRGAGIRYLREIGGYLEGAGLGDPCALHNYIPAVCNRHH